MARVEKYIGNIRSFNRFYTNIIGVLDRHILQSAYSLSEVRILFEIYNSNSCTGTYIKELINIDEGYLSRILDGFVKKGLVKKVKSQEDNRVYHLSLTKKGKTQFMKLDKASNDEIKKLTEKLGQEQLEELVKSMESITHILSQTHST